MSVQSEITRITGNVANAYTAVSGKGGTLPSARNSSNLSAAIQSIPTSVTITKTITANGIYNASADNADGYSQVTVAIPTYDGGVEERGGYTVTLEGLLLPDETEAYDFELVDDSVVPNPDRSTYDGVYRSTNYHIPSSTSAMRIDFWGYPEFTVYIRSYAESSYDYTVASTLDAPEISLSYYTDRTRNIQKRGTGIASYTEVKYPNDGGEHHIYLFYRKNATTDTNDDRGYILIKK